MYITSPLALSRIFRQDASDSLACCVLWPFLVLEKGKMNKNESRATAGFGSASDFETTRESGATVFVFRLELRVGTSPRL